MLNQHKFFFILFIILVSASPVTWGWNTYGHLLVSELAVAELGPEQQREFESVAYSVVKQMDSQKRLYLMRTFSGTSAVAQLSVFPDEWRGIPIARLYADYGQSLPPSMQPYAESTSNSWHYINQPYQPDANTTACPVEQSENIVSVLPDLIAAYSESSTKEDRGLALAFILHFVADAHNPLHTITRMDNQCNSDRGGNDFCVAYRRGSSSCEQNLHQAWDSALGFFDEYEQVVDAVKFVSYVDVDPDAQAILDPKVWAEEGFNFARLIYSAKSGQALDPYYVDEGKIISYEQIALSAKRLAAILDSL